ncbi:hypothetical protein BGW38_008105 [Lunasporangiospora selenospora]|uniref:RNI-like protein n=1 Tax=Lunasporangiospora selenospora TaxID=979761 RepID=A0A9P6FYP8_9FUNG|nr:hypothetical protein BGW38_008105 [Lunasporangiospora selenospora]
MIGTIHKEPSPDMTTIAPQDAIEQDDPLMHPSKNATTPDENPSVPLMAGDQLQSDGDHSDSENSFKETNGMPMLFDPLHSNSVTIETPTKHTTITDKDLTQPEQEEQSPDDMGDSLEDALSGRGTLEQQQQDDDSSPTAEEDSPSAEQGVQRQVEERLQSTLGVTAKPKLKRPPLRPVDLNEVPKRSILKRESAYPFTELPARNPLFKSQWLQSTVSKLAVMSGPAPPTAYTANQPSMFRKLVSQATAAAAGSPVPYASQPSHPNRQAPGQRPRPPNFSSDRPLSLLEGENNASSSSLLSDKSLKRVRFSVGQLTTEHIFHHDDAYESAEESEAPRSVQITTTVVPLQAKRPLTTSEGVVVDDNIYTAKEIQHYYLVACGNREEPPIERLVRDMRTAADRPLNPLLTTIDLAGELLPRKTLEPIADVLTLEFGLTHLILDDCGLEDDTLKMLLYSLLLTDTLTTLSLQDNRRIKATGIKYISVFVKKTKALKNLNISGIPMDKKATEFLAHALKIGRYGFGSRVEDLRMDRCGLRGNMLEVMAPSIRESNLRHLSIRSNRIGSTGGVWIGVMMRDYDDQPNKAVPINNEEQGFRRVFPGIANPELLKRIRGIESLDVSNNDLRQGADYIAQTLRRNMSLKTLVLAHNNMDPGRLVVLADALKLNIGLETLDITGNRVCGPVITVQLDLTGNDLVDIAGVMALSVSIRMNKSLTLLDMNVPPNDAEFARLSRDILKACISNMVDKTGTNAGMPSLDDMPTNTIFRQPPSPTANIPEQQQQQQQQQQQDPALTREEQQAQAPPSSQVQQHPLLLNQRKPMTVEDARWALLESVAGELYLTKETLNTTEKLLNREKNIRAEWLDRFYREYKGPAPELNERVPSPDSPQTQPNGHALEPQQQTAASEVTDTSNFSSPFDQKMIALLRGTTFRGPPQMEHLYHQCRRHQSNILSLLSRVDNERAIRELEVMNNLVNMFLQAYTSLFALPELPPHMISKRTNSLPPPPPLTPVGQPTDTTAGIVAVPEAEAADQPSVIDPILSSNTHLVDLDQTADTPESVAINGDPLMTEEPVGSFLLEDEDDLDDEVFTNDALLDVRRNNLLTSDLDEPELSIEEPVDESNTDEASTETKGYHGRGLKPTPLKTTTNLQVATSHESAERSPSSVNLASPLEKLRKAAEEEEGEILRRGRDILENDLEAESAEESMSGEELKIQILASGDDVSLSTA